MVASQVTAVTRQVGPVAVGLGVLGLSSFAFLSVSGRVLGPAELAPLGTLWVLINALGPALFQPLEQEVSRAVAERAAHGQGARPVFVQACRLAAGAVVIAGVALFLARRPLADHLFGGQQLLVLALLLGLVGLASEHLTRGAFAGGGAFPRYGTQLGIDGLLRIGSAAALALLGVATAGNSKHHTIAHLRLFAQRLLQVFGINLQPRGRHNHILAASFEVEIALFIHGAEIE